MERIIRTRKECPEFGWGDVHVLDPRDPRVLAHCAQHEGGAVLMCGSGTTLVVAARLGRRFVGCDKSDLAIATTSRRLELARAPYRVVATGRWSELAPRTAGGRER